jgi:hypothetical protein
MTKIGPLLPLGALLFVVLATGSAAANSAAAEDPRKFVDGLRERGYLDTASEYLEHVASQPGMSADVKQALPFEQASLLIEQAAKTRDAQLRQWQLDQAEEKLKQFLTANPEHAQAQTARERLAGLLVYRADDLMRPGGKSGTIPAINRKQAYDAYASARQQFEEAGHRYREELDKILKGEQLETREQLGTAWLGASLSAARVTFLMAQSTEPGGEQSQKLLEEAAARCAKIYKDYPQRLAGVTARFYEGRCRQELGDSKQSLAAYNALLTDLPDGEPAFRQLKTQVLRYALECWLSDKNYQTAVDKSLAWAKSAKGAELQDADWIAVKLSTATALAALADSAPKQDAKTKGFLRDGRELVAQVLAAGEPRAQAQARELLAQLGSGTSNVSSRAAATAAGKAPPNSKAKNFEDIYQLGNDAVDQIKTDEMELNLLRQEKPLNQARIAELKTEMQQKGEEAFAAFKRALALADAQTDPEKLNFARYVMCYFQYQKGNYFDAAVLGSFLAKRFPDSPNARSAARVALAALDAIYRQQREKNDGDLSFETTKLFDMAQFISGHWPDQPEADLALDVLINYQISSGNYDESAKMLAMIKADSPRRANAEARLGQAFWNRYVRAMQEARERQAATGENAVDPTVAEEDKKKLDALLDQAQKTLERAIADVRKQSLADGQAMMAALSLAQLHLNASQPERAITLLEDPKIGPLTLLKQNNPATQMADIPGEIEKTALRAYVAVEPQQVDKATAAMDALEQIYSKDPKGDERLTQLLITTAYDLQQQMQELARQGDKERQRQLAKAVGEFLDRISKRATGTDFKTLNWIAATCDGLAEGLKQNGKLTEEGKTLYLRSGKIYEQMVERAAKDPNFVGADKLPGIKLRMAIALRSGGNYDKALAVLGDVLTDKPQLIPAQVEAARTYQARGENDKPDYYVPAIKGPGKGSSQIWGWGKIALQTSNNPNFRDTFHEARYNIAVCRSRYGEAQKDDLRRKLLELAKKDIRNTKDFEPTMGGDKWKPLYDKLLRNIQKELGEKPIGLKEFEQKQDEPPAGVSQN